ncbi:MAG: hypothetical protein WKF58_07855 [Ilumatobacteraceae bacterium]
MSFERPAPDLIKLVAAWEEFEAGEEAPGKVLANLEDGRPRRDPRAAGRERLDAVGGIDELTSRRAGHDMATPLVGDVRRVVSPITTTEPIEPTFQGTRVAAVARGRRRR